MDSCQFHPASLLMAWLLFLFSVCPRLRFLAALWHGCLLGSPGPFLVAPSVSHCWALRGSCRVCLGCGPAEGGWRPCLTVSEPTGAPSTAPTPTNDYDIPHPRRRNPTTPTTFFDGLIWPPTYVREETTMALLFGQIVFIMGVHHFYGIRVMPMA